ncbi:hypothetical protein KI387_024572, partial [Taxus chinensis]
GPLAPIDAKTHPEISDEGPNVGFEHPIHQTLDVAGALHNPNGITSIIKRSPRVVNV